LLEGLYTHIHTIKCIAFWQQRYILYTFLSTSCNFTPFAMGCRENVTILKQVCWNSTHIAVGWRKMVAVFNIISELDWHTKSIGDPSR
jgi:hypothetical protein